MNKPKVKIPPPPSNLSKEARDWWNKINSGWVLDDQSLLLLGSALESFDRMRQAQRLIKQSGLTFKDRFGQIRANPACTVERDSKASLLSNLKALGLNLEPINDTPGRPAGK